jgi:signal transduction histidine kinase
MIMLRSKSDEANRMKTKFIQNMSHEIRTPLNAIIGFSQLLCSGDVSEELKGEFQEIISQNSQSLLRIFDDILDISRLEEGSMEFTYEPLDVNGFLKNILRSFALYQKDDLKLLLDDTSGNVNIVTDRNGLTTILNNLLSNAFKFTPSGQITVGYKPQGNGVQFCVRDTGVGIRPEATNKIFGRFEKADDFTAGTGLGLAICKELVIALHGVISVDSAVGAGSAFFVWLPSLDSAVR